MASPRSPKGSSPASIHLCCQHASGPGLDWSAAVSFKQIRGSFSVWISDDEPPFTMRRVANCPGALSWREAAVWLRGCNRGLGGDLFPEIDVEGVHEHQAEMLRIAWVTNENPLAAEHDMLLRMLDSDIHYLWKAHRSLTTAPARALLREWLSFVAEGEPHQPHIDAVARRLGFDTTPPPEVLLERLQRAEEERQDQAASHAARDAADPKFEIAKIVVAFRACDEQRGKQHAEVIERSRRLDEYLTRAARDEGALAQRVVDVPGVGHLDLDLVLGRVEGWLRLQPDYLLSQPELEECARRVPAAPTSALVRLVDSWVAAPSKPERSSEKYGVSFRSGRQWAFVQWLMPSPTPKLLSTIGEHDQRALRHLTDWLRASRSEAIEKQAGPGMGGAWGAAILAARKRDWLTFVDAFEAAAAASMEPRAR